MSDGPSLLYRPDPVAEAVLRCWTYAFQPPENDLCAAACLMISSQTWNQRPNPSLHPWGKFFHRLWLLSEYSLWDEAPFSINSSDMDLQTASEEPNEALQTWDSIWGDSPLWSSRSHYVRGWSCGSIFLTTGCSKSDGSVSQQLRPFMSPSHCFHPLICLLAQVIVCNIASLSCWFISVFSKRNQAAERHANTTHKKEPTN